MSIQTLQRSTGTASVDLAIRRGQVRLTDLGQSGSAKAILPAAGPEPEVVFLNTSGGLTGGDRLAYALSLGPGVRATATTQTAERAYRAGQGSARVSVSAQVGPGGWLDWIPQDTILFEGAALHRTTDIALQGVAGCLICESLIFGRSAMGEILTQLALTDRRRITRDGQLVLVDPLALDSAALTAGSAVLGQARAVASVIMVAAGAADRVHALRDKLTVPGVVAAASGWDDRLSVRLMARDAQPLRRQLIRILGQLRDRTPMPRVWQDIGEAA